MEILAKNLKTRKPDDHFHFYKKQNQICNSEGSPPCIIFCYCGGHGGTIDEKQRFLLNSSNPDYAVFNVELKLRTIANIIGNDVRLCSVFDCCRVSLESEKWNSLFPKGRNVGIEEPTDVSSDPEDPVKYFHLTACNPGGVDYANGKFAANLL